ncbi:MAG: PQQ-like beta-propeller repeat protein [Planctomycetota bacterium]|nr:PQQ-like beta-propeller repeat protein [Planctomycetota bacterium]
MSQETTSIVNRRRLYLPMIALGILGIAFISTRLLPEEYPPFVKSAVNMSGFLLALIVATTWWVFFSRFSWLLKIEVVAIIFSAYYGAVKELEFNGDVEPKIIWRWEKPREDKIAEHRTNAPKIELEAISVVVGPEDFPNYRNRNLDGVVTGPEIYSDWKTNPPKPVWKPQPCGAGYSGFSIAGNLAVTMEQRADREVVVAYDFATGTERWTHSWVARHYDAMGGEGPMITPTIDGDLIYVLGGTGHFACLDAKTGQPNWEKKLLEDNKNIQWGMSGSPLIYKDLVIVNPGEQEAKDLSRAIRAYDKKSGELRWQVGNNRAGYTSPMVATLLDTEMLLIFDGAEIAGYNPLTGSKYWARPWITNQGINVAQPIPIGNDKLFITSSYGVGCGLVKISKDGDKFKEEELWHNFNLRCRFTSPVLFEGFIYGLDEGMLVCLDPNDGKRKWKGGRYGQGQLLRQNNKLIIQAESGDLVMVEATPAEFKELGKFKALSCEKTWNYPSLARGFAWVRNHNEMACYDLRKK